MSHKAVIDLELLDRPAPEMVRRLAMAEIERARRAREAIDRGDDPEALHDLRVSVRRLRSHLQAYAAEVGDAAGHRLRRRLKRLGSATNPGRDAEVGIAELERLAEGAPPGEARSNAALRVRLARRRAEVGAALSGKVLKQLDRTLESLAECIGAWRIEPRLSPLPSPGPPLFRDALRERVERLEADLLADLEAARDPRDAEATHRARLAAKRLRYLVEPLASALDEAAAPVARLKGLQDLLGEQNDLRVLATELAADAAAAERWWTLHTAGLETPGKRPPGSRDGRRRLASRIGAERARLRERFDEGWIGDRAAEHAALESELAVLRRRLA